MAKILGEDRHPHAQCFREVCDAVTALTDLPVVFNAHEFPGDVREGDVVYHLDNGPLLREPAVSRAAAIWDFSPGNVAAYPPRLREKVCHVPLGHHQSMERFRHDLAPWSKKTADVVWMGTVSPRRREVLDALEERCIKVEIVPHVLYGEGRDRIVERAKMTLNMLNHPESVFPGTRALYAACNRVPCVSEDARESPEWATYLVSRRSLADVVEACLAAGQGQLTKMGNGALVDAREHPLRVPQEIDHRPTTADRRLPASGRGLADVWRGLDREGQLRLHKLIDHVRELGTDSLPHFGAGYRIEGGYALQQHPEEFAAVIEELRTSYGVDNGKALYVEIGVGSGGCARLMSEELNPATVGVIDNGTHPRSREIDGNLAVVEARGARVERFRGSSSAASGWLRELVQQHLDEHNDASVLVMIDADHSLEGCSADLAMVAGACPPGAFVLAHDTAACPGVRQAWATATAPGGLIEPLYDLVANDRGLGIGLGRLR